MMDLQLIPNIKHTKANNFFLLAGPCAIESEDMAMRIAEKVISLASFVSIFGSNFFNGYYWRICV